MVPYKPCLSAMPAAMPARHIRLFMPHTSCPPVPSLQMRLRQRACSQGVLWRLEAEALLEVEEVQLPLGRREARFAMLEGDFQVCECVSREE